MDVKELKCADKIAQELKNREFQLADLYERIDSYDAGDDDHDRAREEIQEMAYGIDTRTISRVIWSGGGPADYLEITRNELGEILLVEYLYQDWYDGAKLTVSEDSPAYRYALELQKIARGQWSLAGSDTLPAHYPALEPDQIGVEMTIQRLSHAGAWQICDIVDGYLFTRTYYGYTRGESVRLFKQEREGER